MSRSNVHLHPTLTSSVAINKEEQVSSSLVSFYRGANSIPIIIRQNKTYKLTSKKATSVSVRHLIIFVFQLLKMYVFTIIAVESLNQIFRIVSSVRLYLGGGQLRIIYCRATSSHHLSHAGKSSGQKC